MRTARAQRMPRRITDWVEVSATWVLVSLAVLSVALSVIVGLRAHGTLAQRAHQEAAARTPVQAVVLSDAVPRIDALHQGAALLSQAPVLYQDADGMVRKGQALVEGSPRAGQTARVWVDHQHQLVPAPTSPGDATATGWVAGGVTAAVALALLLLTWLGIRRVTLLRNCGKWEREWALVEPGWSGRADRLS